MKSPEHYDILAGRWKRMDEEELKAILLKENEEFMAFYKEHQACEKRLKAFAKKGSLTAGEAVKEKLIKKRKLVLKDKMYRIMAEKTKVSA